MKKSFLIPILTLLFLSLNTMASAQWVTTQLTDNTSPDEYPQINASGQVVWYGFDGSDNEIFFYDGTEITQLTNNSYNDVWPQINASGQVVWVGYDGSDYEIFFYDGSTVTQLTSNTYNDEYPQINASGQVVWQSKGGSDNGPDYEISFYDGSTITQLTDNTVRDEYPQINASGQVVWVGWYGSDYEIFFYDGSTITQLTNNSYRKQYPQINDSGHVVWYGYDGTDYEIFFYDGSTVIPLTDNTDDDKYPQINACGHVVWVGSDATDFKVFYYDGNTVTQLTENTDDDWNPQINDSGQVVWDGYDGNDNDIFLAENDNITCIDLDDYDLSIWDFSATYDESQDNNTLSYTLIQDAKGKITGFGTFDYPSDDISVDVEIKGKVKGKNNIVTLKYKVKGKDAEGNKILDVLKLELDESVPSLVGTAKKICQKGNGCIKSVDDAVSLPVSETMNGEAFLDIESLLDDKGKKLTGSGELILSNGDEYPLSFKGKNNSKKGETKYQLKGDNETTKGIKFKLKIDDGSGSATQVNGKAFGQKLKYKKE